MTPLVLASDAVVLSGPDGPRIGPARVRCEGGWITAVEAGAAPSLGDVDLTGTLLAPAFVNAHTHLAMSSLRGLGGDAARRGNVVEDLWFGLEAALEPADVRAFARMGALECLLSGAGAVFDHYYAAGDVADALDDVGLDGVVAPTLQDLSGPGSGAAEASLQEAVDLHAADRDGIAVALGPHATDTVSAGLWARLTAVARDLGLPVHVHVAQSGEEVARARERGFASPVARLVAEGTLEGVPRVMVVHGIHVSARDRTRLDPARDVLVHTPASQLQFAVPAHVAAWSGDGFPVALGTDAGACNDGMDVQRELLLLGHAAAFATTFDRDLRQHLDRDVPAATVAREADRRARWDDGRPFAEPAAALSTVWEVPGGLHPRLPTGRIAPGCRAALAAWDRRHPALWPSREPLRALAFGAVGPALHTLVVRGRVVGEVGAPRRMLAEPRVRAWVDEADARLRELEARTGLG